LRETGENRKASVIQVDPSRGSPDVIERAATCVLSGGLVAYPTESFYGLAADATNGAAIKRLFQVKGRPLDRPVLVLISSVEMLRDYVRHIPLTALQLMDAFWPGGLTLVFEGRSKISPLLTAGTGKIGVRLSSHPVATALTRAAGVPITGTSANVSGEPACSTAKAVLMAFGDGVDLVLDGGETLGKGASTVLDMTVDPPRILREGMISRSRLEEFISLP
jgi:L-threonylcarbamoyladenylate synthase